MLKAQQVQMFWDAAKKSWVVRIQVGEEVVRRPAKANADADDSSLRTLASQVVTDEGYEFPAEQVQIQR